MCLTGKQSSINTFSKCCAQICQRYCCLFTPTKDSSLHPPKI